MQPGYSRFMRAIMLEVPEGFLEERRRNGHDRLDEVWDGVLHMVPQPAFQHNALGTQLLLVLNRVGSRLGLVPTYEPGFYDPVKGLNNYRVPDLALVHPDHISKRGIEGRAALLVEILSPNDESRDKLPFFGQMGVQEVWIVDPNTRALEVYTSRDGVLHALAPALGRHRSPLLGIELATIPGPKLAIYDGELVDEI